MRRGGDEPRRSLGPGPGLGFGVLLYNFGILLSSGTFLLSWEDGFSTRRLPSVFFSCLSDLSVLALFWAEGRSFFSWAEVQIKGVGGKRKARLGRVRKEVRGPGGVMGSQPRRGEGRRCPANEL